jgi:hypothetical protein
MAFLWLHCANEQDRVIDLLNLREAYDAGVAFIRTKSESANVLPYSQIEFEKFAPIAEHDGYQIIIGTGKLGMPTFVYFNGCSQLGLEKIRVQKFDYLGND